MKKKYNKNLRSIYMSQYYWDIIDTMAEFEECSKSELIRVLAKNSAEKKLEIEKHKKELGVPNEEIINILEDILRRE